LIEADLQRLREQHFIRGYEVLETDTEGNVIDVRIFSYPAPNKIALKQRMRDAFERVSRRNSEGGRAFGRPTGS
jgi:hypothetical protein